MVHFYCLIFTNFKKQPPEKNNCIFTRCTMVVIFGKFMNSWIYIYIEREREKKKRRHLKIKKGWETCFVYVCFEMVREKENSLFFCLDKRGVPGWRKNKNNKKMKVGSRIETDKQNIQNLQKR